MANNNDIDKKIYRISVESVSSDATTANDLAKQIAEGTFVEFSYTRNQETQYCQSGSVRKYVDFCQAIGVLDDKATFQGREAAIASPSQFEIWLGNLIVNFNQNHGLSVDELKSTVDRLVIENRVFPTSGRLGQELSLEANISEYFVWLMRLQSILRPATLQVCRRWLWIPSNTFACPE